MTFAKRFRLYLIGFSLGIFAVMIFFGPKAFQCSYFPNSRALEEAKIYPMSYSESAQQTMEAEGIDSIFLYNQIFKKSKITNFGSEEVRATPCRIYRAQYREEKSYDVVFKICKKETVLEEIKKAE